MHLGRVNVLFFTLQLAGYQKVEKSSVGESVHLSGDCDIWAVNPEVFGVSPGCVGESVHLSGDCDILAIHQGEDSGRRVGPFKRGLRHHHRSG